MRILEIIENLKKEFKDDYVERKNGTLLLGIGDMPNCKHMLFKPLSDDCIQHFLVEPYENAIPNDYIKLLKFFNGFNLFSQKVEIAGYTFASSSLVVFGLPMTPPFQRPQNEEEPFDIRIEDLGRHDNISQDWLKIGNYYKHINDKRPYDIFIDTKTNFVYSCEKNTDLVDSVWESMDECLCDIYELISN